MTMGQLPCTRPTMVIAFALSSSGSIGPSRLRSAALGSVLVVIQAATPATTAIAPTIATGIHQRSPPPCLRCSEGFASSLLVARPPGGLLVPEGGPSVVAESRIPRVRWPSMRLPVGVLGLEGNATAASVSEPAREVANAKSLQRKQISTPIAIVPIL